MSVPRPPVVPDVPDVSLIGEGGTPGLELATILDEIADHLTRWVAFPNPESRDAVAAWIVHTWVLYSEPDGDITFDSTPRLGVLSPVKQCGKTRLLEVLELLVANPRRAFNLSPAAMFRLIDKEKPTILLDEVDTIFSKRTAEQHEDLRGMINAGHRRGATVARCDGPRHDLRDFMVFGPLVLAGIGDLPDTVLDRCIIISMRRRTAGEKVQAFRYRKAEQRVASTCEALGQWSRNAYQHFTDIEPTMPEGITDRPADVWEPLIAIGDHAGTEWSHRIRHACVTLNTERVERAEADPSLGLRLLADCRTAFADADRLTTDELITRLIALEESPWGDLYGKPLDSRKLARLINPFGVKPGTHRFGDGTARGYTRATFHDAWDRYLESPFTHPQEAKHPEHPERTEATGQLEAF